MPKAGPARPPSAWNFDHSPEYTSPRRAGHRGLPLRDDPARERGRGARHRLVCEHGQHRPAHRWKRGRAGRAKRPRPTARRKPRSFGPWPSDPPVKAETYREGRPTPGTDQKPLRRPASAGEHGEDAGTGNARAGLFDSSCQNAGLQELCKIHRSWKPHFARTELAGETPLQSSTVMIYLATGTSVPPRFTFRDSFRVLVGLKKCCPCFFLH